jgi:toxin ParE1/3/4
VSYRAQEVSLTLAKDVYSRIRKQVGTLSQYADRNRPGRVEGTRELAIIKLPYLVIMEVADECVFILAVVHTARKYP